MKILITIQVFAVSISLFAQEHFSAGFIIFPNGDTLSGEILKHPANDPEQFCRFRETSSSSIRNYSARELNGYAFNSGERYLSNQFEPKIDSLTSSFVRQIMEGTVSMYLHRGDYYLSKTGEILKIAWTSNQKQLVISRRLRFFLLDCIKIKVNGQKLSPKTLIKLLQEYNNTCFDNVKLYYPEGYIKYRSFGILLGSNLNRYRVAVEGINDNISKVDFGPEAGFLLGMNANFSIPTLKNNLSLHFEASVTRQQFLRSINTALEKVEINADLKTVKLAGTIQRKFYTKFAALFINTGISLGFIVDQSNGYIREIVSNQTVETRLGTAVNNFNADKAILIGFGLDKLISKNSFLTFEIRNEIGSGITELGKSSSNVTSFLLSYSFLKVK